MGGGERGSEVNRKQTLCEAGGRSWQWEGREGVVEVRGVEQSKWEVVLGFRLRRACGIPASLNCTVGLLNNPFSLSSPACVWLCAGSVKRSVSRVGAPDPRADGFPVPMECWARGW